jgi:hypothetical protein
MAGVSEYRVGVMKSMNRERGYPCLRHELGEALVDVARVHTAAVCHRLSVSGAYQAHYSSRGCRHTAQREYRQRAQERTDIGKDIS